MKLTQGQLALRVNASKKQIQRIENSQSDLTHSWLKRIAAALDCKPWELLDPAGGGLYQQERVLRYSMPNRIREFRAKNELTQKELATAVGTRHQQIYKLETGRAELTHKWLKRLAPALGCEPWELLDNVGGGLSQDERELLTAYRCLPPEEKQAIHQYFMAGHKNNIIASYNGLTKADREVVDWFLFEERVCVPSNV